MSREAWHKRSVGPSSSPGKSSKHRSVNSSEGKWWIKSVRRDGGRKSKRSPRRRFEQGPESPRENSYDACRDSDSSWGRSTSVTSGWEEQRPERHICRDFQNGYCEWGGSCYFSHDWTEGHMDLQPVKPAGIRFRLAQDAAQVLLGPPWARPDTRTNTGPMRPRIVGNLEELGFCKEETSWEPQGGLDLWWEGDCWTSTVISTEPDLEIEFCVVRLDQAESHPGLMQAWERTEMHEARHFTWGPRLTIRSPAPGEVAEVFLRASNCHCRASSWAAPPVWLRDREQLVAGPGRPPLGSK
ncbi:unnamed protein product [Symbiodinium natans]|uniref:C3H1-type domain-containing protein n=1 Tax=Symbiodinium natans TaxID=878477 RepID=A0A812TA55_9DINO|nr:unnamed protein product [Symbiodinium natans]